MNRRKFLKIACYGGAAALLASYPVFVERNIVQINRYRIPVPFLPKSFNGFRVVHLTDLHLGFLVSESFIEGVIKKANSLKPDVIVCTGDYVHARNSIKEIDIVWPILSKLNAKYGVYSVLGNHDHWADTEKSLQWLQRSGQSVRHTFKPVYRGKDRILFGGAGDYWEDDLNIDQCFSSSNESDCRILLAHNPDSIDTVFNTPLSLVLSGHTHGGQVSIPFYGPPVLPVKNKRYSSGLIKTKKGNLFISKGIGWAIYPVRFNCYPEIAVLELMNTKESVL
ncbi:MAG: metallophosphoesterase [Pseudomonadota bacterium]